MKLRDAPQFLRFTWDLTNGKIAWGILVSLFVGLTEGLSIIMLLPIIAAASPSQSEKIAEIPLVGAWLSNFAADLKVVLFIFVILIAIQALLSRYRSLLNQRILLSSSDKMRKELLEKVGMARWEAIRAKRSADLNHVLANETHRIMSAINDIQNLIQNFVLITIYLALAAFVSLPMALFATVVGAILFLLLYPIRQRAKTHGKETTHLYETQNRTVLEFISSLRLIKLFCIEKKVLETYAENLNSFREKAMGFLAIASLGTVAFQVGAAMIASLFVWLSLEIYNLDIARLSVLVLIFIRLAPRFNTVQNAMQSFLENVSAYKTYQDTFQFFVNNQETDVDTRLLPPQLTTALQIRNVTVKFPNSDTPALDDVSVKIRANRVTALIGPSGSGKSTLADILLGLTQPDSGEIVIDAFPLSDSYRRAWRSSIACVSQDAILLNDTIAANLRVARLDATDDEIWAALDRARIGDFIRNLPKGLNTNTKDRGTRFSGGERQRITLARALLRRPQVLVLDEATSALDWKNQQEIARTIEDLRGELTVITIAHRPSLITFADDVISLENGRVIEKGTFSELRADPNSALSKMIEGDRSD